MDARSIASLLSAASTQLTQHSSSARLDAELLLCHCLQKPRTFLYTWPEHTLDAAQLEHFNELIERRKNGEPIAYLTGEREFWSQSFEVTPDTLIPRSDTETLVEQSLAKLGDTEGPFLDLGTGSGIIAICVALERPDVGVTATDISDAALEVARTNATKLNAKVNFIHSNWFESLNKKSFAVIASNPPYIAEGDPHLQLSGLPFEPISALQSCDNGFADITAIITDAPAYIKSGGWLLLEHGHSQAAGTRNIMLEQGFITIDTIQDLSGNDRVTLGQLA